MSEPKKYRTPNRTAITCYKQDRDTFNRLAALVSVLIGKSATASETITEAEKIVRDRVTRELAAQESVSA